MSSVDLGLMFMLGLASSLHCVQMCGPIVLTYSAALGEAFKKSNSGSRNLPALLGNHLAYNAGRILTYSFLGAVAGVAGGALGFIGELAGFSHALAIVSGVLMIVVGISMLGVIPARILGSTFFRIPTLVLRRVSRFMSAPGSGNRLLLGLALGFLPCGLIYAALLKAMASGTAAMGSATMAAFGLGTATSLLALGLFSSAIRIRLNRWGSQVAAIGVTVMGVVLIWRGTMNNMLMMGGRMHAHH